VFLIGFSHLVFQENLHQEILQRLPQIFGIIVPLFKYVETIEQIEVTRQEAKKEEDSDDGDFSHGVSDPELLKVFMKDFLREQAKDGQNMLMNLNDEIREHLSDEEKKNDDTTDDEDNLEADEFILILTNEVSKLFLFLKRKPFPFKISFINQILMKNRTKQIKSYRNLRPSSRHKMNFYTSER